MTNDPTFFEYQLNALECAIVSDAPTLLPRAKIRRQVLEYVANLEAQVVSERSARERAERVYRLAEQEVGETLLHASYSIKPKQFNAVQFAMRAMLSELRSTLGLPEPSRSAPSSEAVKP
jgi:hypothetical protein